jgi:hypothetical protein
MAGSLCAAVGLAVLGAFASLTQIVGSNARRAISHLALFGSLGFPGVEAVFVAALVGPAQVASRLGEILMGRRLGALKLGLIAFGLRPVAGHVCV